MTPLSQRKRVVFRCALVLVMALAVIAGAEAVARARGIRPWRVNFAVESVRPGGRFFAPHSTLGYTHLPGHFTVTITGGYSFVVTHMTNTLRISQPLSRYQEPGRRPEIWIFGCSFTHGWCVDDDKTYAWLLQEKLPGFQVVNFGVSGYGTVQSLLQFREAVKHATPALAILAYADFHDERNTFARTRRKTVVPWNRLGNVSQPYALLDGDDRLEFRSEDRIQYREFPFMRQLAFSHFLEMTWNEREQRAIRSHAVSEALVAEMARCACDHNARFLLVSLDTDGGMGAYALRHGIPWADLRIDLDQPGRRNLPYDRHPSAASHRLYAAKLESAIRIRFPDLMAATAAPGGGPEHADGNTP